jgi:CheY-like chemotaxis protein
MHYCPREVLEPFGDHDPVLFLPSGEGSNQSGNMSPRGASRLREKKRGNRVVMIGTFRELALYRAEVLRQSGFRVSVPESTQEAVLRLLEGDFDSVVLSYTLPSETVEQLAEVARESCPNCSIIAIADTQVLDKRITPDAIALAQDGPPALLAALHKVLALS